MTIAELLDLLRTQRVAVQASIGPGGRVQAALIGIAVTDSLEIVFDTLETTRKAQNLRGEPTIALVVGGWITGDERTVQYEGFADEPTGQERDRIKKVYFDAWPDGRSRQSWTGLVYVRVRPTWIRFSDFNRSPPFVVEYTGQQLAVPPANER
ncbi:MAG: pyridoxamine 5'-phosphate oxidase family protein [Gemmatimonadaceae bacterium]